MIPFKQLHLLAIHFHKLTVKDVRQETPDCVSIAFEIPKNIEREFHFIHGQNVTVRIFKDGGEIRRSYSICSSPLEKELRIAVKKVSYGQFSLFANEKLKKGDVLEVLPPTGRFYTGLNPAARDNYVFFAAGSGITPVISIIKTILATEQKSNVTLFFGNRNIASVIFKQQLEELKDKYLQRFSVFYIFSREQTESAFNYGRIDVAKLNIISRIIKLDRIDNFFICGPEQLIFTVKDFLCGWGIDPEKIHFELFTTPTKEHTKIYETATPVSKDGSEITIKIDGRSFDFNLGYNDKTILDAGLAEGADLPFACKGGVCCTCKAKLIEGEVEMEANYGLEKSEVTEGFILTCQSHPRTAKVVVDYDEA